MYKIVPVLKTRHVEPWAEYVFSEKILEKSQLHAASMAIKKAVECGWFEGDQPDVDEMLPKDVIELSEKLFKAHNKSMGIDEKN